METQGVKYQVLKYEDKTSPRFRLFELIQLYLRYYEVTFPKLNQGIVTTPAASLCIRHNFNRCRVMYSGQIQHI